MATASITYTFTNGTNADGVQVNSNFNSILSFLNSEVIQRDASVSFTNIPLLPSSNPTLDNQAARKYYVDQTVQLNIPAGTIVQYAGASAPSGWVFCDGSAYSRTNATYTRLFTAIATTFGVGDGSTTFNVPDFRGKFPVALSAADSEFNALGETGGTKTETLTVNQIPSHTHVQDAHNHTQNSHNHTQDAHNHTQAPHTHTQDSHTHTVFDLTESGGGFANGATDLLIRGVEPSAGDRGTSSKVNSVTPTINSTTASNNSTTGTNQAEIAINIATTAVNQTTGGGQSHNNLPPYIAINFIIKL